MSSSPEILLFLADALFSSMLLSLPLCAVVAINHLTWWMLCSCSALETCSVADPDDTSKEMPQITPTESPETEAETPADTSKDSPANTVTLSDDVRSNEVGALTETERILAAVSRIIKRDSPLFFRAAGCPPKPSRRTILAVVEEMKVAFPDSEVPGMTVVGEAIGGSARWMAWMEAERLAKKERELAGERRWERKLQEMQSRDAERIRQAQGRGMRMDENIKLNEELKNMREQRDHALALIASMSKSD